MYSAFGYLIRFSRKLAPGLLVALTGHLVVGAANAQGPLAGQNSVKTALPEAPSALVASRGVLVGNLVEGPEADSVASTATIPDDLYSSSQAAAQDSAAAAAKASDHAPQTAAPAQAVGPDGKPIRPQTGRIFGIFPNFVAVSGGTKPKPAGWHTDFVLANKQAYDYSSFGFLLISSGLAYAQNSHPSLNTVGGGDAIFWAYLWRGFLDKTDGTYQGTFLFPALLHEDTRYYALGTGSPKKRLLHAVASIVVAHNYDGRPTLNAAGLIGRAGAQAVSTVYYPAGSEGFGVLAQKYAYSSLRNVIYAVIREFSPDAQARVHFGHKSGE